MSHPAVSTEEDGREAARLIARARKCMQDAESERKALVQPHVDAQRETNSASKASLSGLVSMLSALTDRLWVFTKAAEDRKAEEAIAAGRRAHEAASASVAAANAYADAVDDQSQGEIGVDVLARQEAAAKAKADADRAYREAQRREREMAVRYSPGKDMGRAITARNHEVLCVDDMGAAMAVMIPYSEGLIEAVLTAARAYRKVHDRLPPGIGTRTERGI
tara:strand:+ start:786 stop:1448 length:663 start_codon:yes stop_codon:yes gene_type:complete